MDRSTTDLENNSRVGPSVQTELRESGRSPADFRLGDWNVEPSAGRLSRSGRVVRLRPQLMDVLICLAERRGRTCTKEELFDTVWNGNFVAESALARCIAELRRAFGDDAKAPKVIETIPKRGYRLVVPVEFPGRETNPAATTPPRQSGAAPVVPDGSAGLSATGAPVRAAAPGPRHGQWHPHLPAPVAAAAVVAITLGVGLAVRAWVSPAAVPDTRASVVFALADATGDETFDGYVRTLVAGEIENTESLVVLPDDRLRAALGIPGAGRAIEATTVADICRRAAAAATVTASVSRRDGDFLVELEAAACPTGLTLVRQFMRLHDRDEVLPELKRMAGIARARIDLSRPSPPRDGRGRADNRQQEVPPQAPETLPPTAPSSAVPAVGGGAPPAEPSTIRSTDGR